MSESIEELFLFGEEKMEKGIAQMKREFASVRTGRANPAVLDKVLVEYYGVPTQLRQMSQVTVSEGTTLVITPFDKTIIKEIEKDMMKSDLPELNAGDTVKVFVKIKEGNKERVQGYEGVIIKTQGAGANYSITVRRVFQGVGLERVFPVHSPRIESIKVLRRGSVKRARLYYLRDRIGKATRIKEKISK